MPLCNRSTSASPRPYSYIPYIPYTLFIHLQFTITVRVLYSTVQYSTYSTPSLSCVLSGHITGILAYTDPVVFELLS